jgi:hypothetical protein
MFQILYPLGLLAALGIIIPVIIHLWNIKSGRTLKIGSVFLLGTPTNQRSRSFRVQDWLLLLLRISLIVVAAFLLAEPIYYKTQERSEQSGWILVEKAQFSKIWKQQNQKLDSLLKAGYEIHDFAVGFSKIDIKDSSTVFSIPGSNKLPYHALLRQLDHIHPSGTNIHIFADNQRRNFQGEQPTTRLNLHWNFLPADTASSKWTAAAYQLQNRDIRVLEAQNTEKGTYYKTSEISQGAHPDLQVDSTTITVQVYAAKNAIDGGYVRAAINAIAQYTQRKIKLEEISTIDEVKPNAKVLFWLSDKKMTASQLAALPKGIRLFSYAGNKVANKKSVVQDLQGVALEDVALFKKASDAGSAGEGVWIDGEGSPLLAIDNRAGIDHYLFYSRFRPDWMDMVWSDQMVYFLLPVILPESAASSAFRDAEKLPASEMDIAVQQPNVQYAGVKVQMVAEDLSPWLWYFLLLLLLIERWITYTKRKVAL